MIQHLIVLPVVLPLVAGILLLYQRQGLVHYKRAVSVVATFLLLLASIALLHQAASGDITYYALGDWQPPVWRRTGARPPLRADGAPDVSVSRGRCGVCLRWRRRERQ